MAIAWWVITGVRTPPGDPIMQTSTRARLALTAIGGATLLSALLGSSITARNQAWYRTLRKSALNPPNWVFGPVWTALYGLSALSAARVVLAPRSAARVRALSLWALQQALNAAWTPLFFGRHRPRAALADLALLWAALGAYRNAAGHVDRLAARLVTPYIAWLSFAAFLNERVVRANPSRALPA
jgi:benzodiazapine receptor